SGAGASRRAGGRAGRSRGEPGEEIHLWYSLGRAARSLDQPEVLVGPERAEALAVHSHEGGGLGELGGVSLERGSLLVDVGRDVDHGRDQLVGRAELDRPALEVDQLTVAEAALAQLLPPPR